MSVLDAICQQRRKDVAAAQARMPLDRLREAARGRVHHSLIQRLRQGTGTAIIAEMKKASPSAGVLVADYRPAELAVGYRDAGAAALSVLTEPHHFLGREEDLRAARAAVELPILRKDFMVDSYQVVEAAAWGADVVLLIVAALDRLALQALHRAAIEAGLEVLVEVHDAAELELALELDPAIVGVNSRDLKTLTTDLAVGRKLIARIPRDRLAVAESGIRTRAELLDLSSRGYRGFLIGESLLRSGDPAARLRELQGR